MLKRIQLFLIPVGAFVMLGLAFTLFQNKIDLHLTLTSFHTSSLDNFFKNFTEIGHGLTACAIVLIVALMHIKNFLPIFLVGISSFAISGLLVQLFKKVVFTDIYRPKKIIPYEKLHLIDGVKINEYFSFPSGHATTTFMIFTFLSLIFWKNKAVLPFFAVLALIGAYSRVYTSQHWLSDVLAGAFLGVGITLLVYAIFKKYSFKSYFHTTAANE